MSAEQHKVTTSTTGYFCKEFEAPESANTTEGKQETNDKQQTNGKSQNKDNEYSINPNIVLPKSWRVFPPNVDTLQKLYKLGYFVTYIFLSNNKGLNTCSMNLDLEDVKNKVKVLETHIVFEIHKQTKKYDFIKKWFSILFMCLTIYALK